MASLTSVAWGFFATTSRTSMVQSDSLFGDVGPAMRHLITMKHPIECGLVTH